MDVGAIMRREGVMNYSPYITHITRSFVQSNIASLLLSRSPTRTIAIHRSLHIYLRERDLSGCIFHSGYFIISKEGMRH